MSISGFIKKLKVREWVNIGFFFVSLSMLIAGSVMLAIAIASIPPMPPYYDIPTTTPAPVLQPNVFFTSSLANGVAWTNDLQRPSSDAFKTLASALKTNVSNAWLQKPNSRVQFSTVPSPVITQINAFSQGQNGVNFYMELVFTDSSVTSSEVVDSLTAEGYLTNAFTSSTSQCTDLVPPTQQSTQSPASPPTVPPVTVTPNPRAYCDVTAKLLTNVFLVDVSDPITGNLDNKLAQISTFLINAPSLVNLNQNSNWNNQEFKLVIYGGNEPSPLGQARNQKSWNQIVSYLNSSIVNPLKADGHELTDALRFVVNNYRPVQGVAGNIIVIADGFDFDEISSATTIATVLKQQFSYSLGFLLMSTSEVQQNVIEALATDFSHFYQMSDVGYLNNPSVLRTQAQWTCEAYYPTAAPPTAPPTRIPLITTASTTVNPAAKTTVNPLLPPISACNLNVLYLIDQSQTMILNGYRVAIQYVIKSATSLTNLNSQSTFAFIIFNQQIVAESNAYTDLNTFIALINSAPQSLGSSDSVVGLGEALKFIQNKSQYNNESYRSILYYITDGNENSGSISSAVNTTKTIRAQLQTEVVGIDLVETATSKRNVQQVIQYGVFDGYTQSVYVGVNQPSDALNDALINSTNYLLKCKASSNCYTGLTFVIETSEAEGANYLDVQIRTVLNILTNYAQLISPFKMSVSVVYFSSPDNLVPNQDGQSGNLFDHVTDSTTAINTLNNTNFSPLGAASDLELGFTITADTIRKGIIENKNLVIFFARGAYEQLSNCCPNPSAAAAEVRQLATVQGVVIGPYSSKTQLDALTGSNSVDANSIIGNSSLSSTQDRALVAQQISSPLIQIIDDFLAKQYCPDVPPYVNPPCEDPIDVLILLHADDKNNWNLILNFTASQLIPDLLGSTGSVTSKTLTTSTPINFAIASYYYLDVLTHADFTYLLSPTEYANLIGSIPFTATKGTATLSTAYKNAIELFEDGRPYASKNLIIITDTMDISDMENAFSEHDSMVQLVGGYTSALTINTNTIPGADYQINVDAAQIDSQNIYSLRQLANALTKNTCIYKPVQIPTQEPVTVVPTLPGPVPVVKARNVWPDLTILIDTSNNAKNPMDDISFEKIRSFLNILLGQYSVGKKGSRFTIATYDGETVEYSCKFVEIVNYYDLSSCQNERLSIYSRNHKDYRNMAQVLTDVRRNIYENSTSGYRSLNENFVILFTLGQSSDTATDDLVNIQRKGIRTISIGLSNSMTNTDLSLFSQTAYMVPDWNSIYSGIDTNYNLADLIFQATTKRRTPSTSNFFGNLVFVVDQSANSYSDHSNVVQYVTKSVSSFLVQSSKTQVSIVPFADSVQNVLSLSSSQSEVDQYLRSWSLSSTSSSSVANVGNAIQYVSNMLGDSSDKASYVIFVVGASNLTGTDLSTQLLKQQNLYVINYNVTKKDNFKNLVLSDDHIFSVLNSQELLNRVFPLDVTVKNPVLQLNDDIYRTQQTFDANKFPTTSIAADIVLLVDETGLTDDDFSRMKNFLVDFTQQFDIGPESTQFALQAYNGRTIPNDGFHLFESTSSSIVQQRIQQLKLAKATENSTDADLAGAIEQELFFFLLDSNGWREDITTYTIIFSHADMFYNRDTSTALNVKNSSTVFALGLNGQKFDYVWNFTNSGFYEIVSDVSTLTMNSSAVVDLLTTLDNDYMEVIYPSVFPIKSIVKADFIFLIDNELESSYNQQVQQFLRDFMESVGTFSTSGNDTRLAVVSYGNSVSINWNLNDRQDVESLRDDINNFQILPSSGSSNLRRAIDAVILNEVEFGVNSSRPSYIIVIASSSTISPKIDVSTSRHLNSRYSTYVIQTNSDNSTFSFAPQVLGTQLTSDRVAINPSLQLSNDRMKTFLPWISDEYTAWKTTFPDK
ncbi:unnamed protein product [Caenorhabditis sp. 36 PRJEB53466]|nr:unnamed protein product [Caenorhabditis sp. 36 PRJEB53466]